MKNNIKIYDLDRFMTDLEPKSIALGNFDGVHIGHQKLMQENIDIAKRYKLTPSVLLFKENTKKLLNSTQTYLTSTDDKIEVLSKMGIDTFCLIEFNEKFRSLSPREFIENLLYKKLNTKYVVVGEDYHFGKGALGDVKTLRKYEEDFSYKTKVVDFKLSAGSKVSSTEIKALLNEGEIIKANEFLGRPYKIRGTVVDGYKRGRTLNFPTANLKTDFSYLIPKDGVYLTRVNVLKQNYFGLSNVGKNPTFENENRKVETYIIDFDKDIYGEKITIEFLEFFRGDIKFDSREELIEQMEKDKKMGFDFIKNKYS